MAASLTDPRIRTTIAAVGASGAVLVLAAAATFGVSTALSVGAGAAIAAANLWALAHVIGALLPGDGDQARAQSRGAWIVVALLKTLGLVAVVWVALVHGVVSPIAMLVGFGALPIGIAIGSLVSDRRTSQV